MKSLVYINNTTSNEPISFECGFDESNSDEIILILHTHSDYIYFDSQKKKILQPPSKIKLFLKEEDVIVFLSSLMFSIAEYFHFKREMTSISFENIIHCRDNTRVVFRLPKENSNSSAKLIVNVFKENKEILTFKLTRTKVTMLIKTIKSATNYLKSSKSFTTIDSEKFVFLLSKDSKRNIAINGIWLRNTEVSIIKHLIDSLIFDYKFLSRVKEYEFTYRQIMCVWNVMTKQIMIGVVHNNKSENIKRGKSSYITVNSKVCAALYLYISEENEFKGDVLNGIL